MGGAFSFQKAPNLYPAFAAKIQPLIGKTVAITGCTSGTGLVAAKLSAERGAHVLMLNRSSERAQRAMADVQACASPEAKVTLIDCDLSDFASVRKAVEEVKATVSKLDVLCNNAGIMAFPDQATKDGYDIQMQTNHLSHFMMTRDLLPLLEATAKSAGEARIVNHSSLARVEMKSLERKYFEKNGGNLGGDSHGRLTEGPRWLRYHQTKLANVVFTLALHKRLSAAGSKVKVVACAPGASSTGLLGSTQDTGQTSLLMRTVLPFYNAMYMQSGEDGTMPLLTCMYNPSVQSGDFFEPAHRGGFKGPAAKKELEPHCKTAENEEVLWEASCAAVGDFQVTDSRSQAA